MKVVLGLCWEWLDANIQMFLLKWLVESLILLNASLELPLKVRLHVCTRTLCKSGLQPPLKSQRKRNHNYLWTDYMLSAGTKNGRSVLIEDGALPWIVQNANNEASPIRRHIELALCHLAQHGKIKSHLIVPYSFSYKWLTRRLGLMMPNYYRHNFLHWRGERERND